MEEAFFHRTENLITIILGCLASTTVIKRNQMSGQIDLSG
jgi:hypothetical protein